MAPTLDGYRNGFKGYEGMNLLHLWEYIQVCTAESGVHRYIRSNYILWICQVQL